MIERAKVQVEIARQLMSPRAFGRRPLQCDLDDPDNLRIWTEIFLRMRSTRRYQSVFEKEQPLVTICIATADRPEILSERAIKSVLRQTYKNLQVIIVGDHCSDETEQLVRSYRDKRIVYYNLPVRGPYPEPGLHRWMVAGTHPMNFALRKASGDFVTHLDEDDTYEDHRIDRLLRQIRQEKADLIYHPFLWEKDDGSWTTFGNGNFQLGQTGTGLVLYHSWLAKIPWNVFAYRLEEPGDWNRLRKVKALGAKLAYADEVLSTHWKFPLRPPFVAQPGEKFLYD